MKANAYRTIEDDRDSTVYVKSRTGSGPASALGAPLGIFSKRKTNETWFDAV